VICVRAARRRLMLLFTTPPTQYMPLTAADLEEITKQ
jgi:hypothetical protein